MLLNKSLGQILILLLLLKSKNLFSESIILNEKLQENRILHQEEKLDSEIQNLNQKLSTYKKLFQQKKIILPNNTFLKKGFTDSNGCIELKGNQKANCIKLEQYQPELNSNLELIGDFRKIIILFFDDSGNLKQIASRIYSDQFQTKEKRILELIQNDPLNSNINENLFIRFVSPTKTPSFSFEEIQDKKFIPLKEIENSKSSPIRNSFKNEAYIKHLKQFLILFDRVSED